MSHCSTLGHFPASVGRVRGDASAHAEHSSALLQRTALPFDNESAGRMLLQSAALLAELNTVKHHIENS
jgi:hypothetical protein